MTTNTLSILIQGGAVGIALALIYLLYWITKQFGDLVKNHINHSTEIQSKMLVAIQKLTGVIENLDRRINGKR